MHVVCALCIRYCRRRVLAAPRVQGPVPTARGGPHDGQMPHRRQVGLLLTRPFAPVRVLTCCMAGGQGGTGAVCAVAVQIHSRHPTQPAVRALVSWRFRSAWWCVRVCLTRAVCRSGCSDLELYDRTEGEGLRKMLVRSSPSQSASVHAAHRATVPFPLAVADDGFGRGACARLWRCEEGAPYSLSACCCRHTSCSIVRQPLAGRTALRFP